MSEYKRQILVGGVAAVIVGIILVASIAYLPLISTTTSSRTTSPAGTTSQSIQQTSTFSTVSSSGLELEILTNATEIQTTGNLHLQIGLVNTRNQNLSLPVNTSANPNIANWDNYDTLCGLSSVEHTFGFALFPGHVTEGNISNAGSPMLLTPPVATTCPNRFYNTGYIQSMVFEPNSHTAALFANASFSNVFKGETVNMLINGTTGNCETSPYFANGTTIENGTTVTSSGTDLAFGCGYGNGINGYWTMPSSGYLSPNMRTNSTILNFMSNLYQDYFHQFSPGSYTVVAEDLWNQIVYAYFQVTPQASPVQIVSVNGPIPPFNPGGPVVAIDLKNVAGIPIFSLNASLQIGSQASAPYYFVFNVSSSNPLLPGQSSQKTQTLIGGGFDSSKSYPLTVSAVLENGSKFSFTQQVMIAPPGTSVSTTSSSNQISSSLVSCSTHYSNGTSTGTKLLIAQESGSTVNLCVRFFYYNPNVTTTFNTLDQLTIYAPVLSSSSTIKNVNSSFSISASIPQIQIGGPQNENEGSLVTYTIRSTGSAPSGTYEIGLASILYPQDIACGNAIYVILQVGNTTNPTVTTSCHYDPTPEENPGVIYSEIVGITNST